MLTLGIETAGQRSGVALLEDGEVLSTRSATGGHSARLLPMIAGALGGLGLSPASLGLVGVASGPGTYTGLRVGVVTAKTLGRATAATVLGIPTLEALATQAPAWATRARVALHAYKRRFLVAWFERDEAGGLVAPAGAPALVSAAEVTSPGPGEVLVTDAADLLGLPRGGAVVEPGAEDCAVAVARLALARLAAGAGDEAYSLSPTYLKPPPVTLRAIGPGGERP